MELSGTSPSGMELSGMTELFPDAKDYSHKPISGDFKSTPSSGPYANCGTFGLAAAGKAFGGKAGELGICDWPVRVGLISFFLDRLVVAGEHGQAFF